MKIPKRLAGVAVLVAALSGCAAMNEGLANLNTLAVEGAKKHQAQQMEAWKSDIAKGRYSGKVRVLLVPSIPDKGGIVKDKAIAMLHKHYGAHAQFEILDEASSASLSRDLGLSNGSLNATLIDMRVKRLERMGGVKADVVLRAGVRLEAYTGINKSTGKIGQSAMAVSWSEFMALGGSRILKQEEEDANFFKLEGVITKSAAAFHETVLTDLMVEQIKTKLAAAEKANL